MSKCFRVKKVHSMVYIKELATKISPCGMYPENIMTMQYTYFSFISKEIKIFGLRLFLEQSVITKDCCEFQ